MLAPRLRWTIAVVMMAGCRSPSPVAHDAAVALVDAAVDAEPAPPRGRFLAIAYSSNDQAEYERCGCPVRPLGGLARRAAEIDRARAEADGVLVVDAGDLFLPADDTPKGWRAPAASEIDRRARLLAAAYARLGVEAFTPGERDLALGLPRLRKVLADAKVPVVSANLVDVRGRAPWAADRLLDVAGVKVGVFGVTASADGSKMRAWGFVARDPAAAARDEVASLRARGARIVVALVHVGPVEESRRLLAATPGVDWAVLGHSARNLEDPELVGDAPNGPRMLEAMAMGRYEGRLDLHVVDGGAAFVSRGARAQLRTILADHREQVADYEKRLPTTTAPKLHDYYAQRLVELRKAITRETAAMEAMPPHVTGNWFENRIIPLDTSVPDQPGVALLVSAYNHESERLAFLRRPVGVKPLNPHVPAPPAHEKPTDEAPTAPQAHYVGNDACNRCHPNAVAVWNGTKHAHALAALEDAHRARSPECVPCHVTGYLRAGGTTDIVAATSPTFANVGCENCHGPGSIHVDAVSKRDTIARKVPATVCLGCHTPDQTDDGFDYDAFLPSVIAPGHGM
ncbi:MAG TPA: multiheme c-type cytochrome [Polyangia bacterium]|nr:multiheme c-type cytochrome [Polyangia bacterium]